MKPKRRHQGPNTGSKANSADQAKAKSVVQRENKLGTVASTRRIRDWLIPGMLGTLVGMGIVSAYLPIWISRANASEQRSADNSLLVTQQLDELFNAIVARLEKGELEDGKTESEQFQDLLGLYRIYDSQFASLNDSNPDTAVAVAFATTRLSYQALAAGDLASSLKHYQRARNKFEKLMLATPESIGLFSVWIHVQSQIISLEIELNKIQAARDVYFATHRKILDTSISLNVESSRWLSSRMASLAALGIELNLRDEALDFAERYEQMAQCLAKRLPSEPNHQEQAAEAAELLNRLSVAPGADS